MKFIADLHLHTTCSDGVLPPEEIVDRAIAKGLKSISITDHDNFEGIDIAKEYAGDRLFIVPGVELSTEIDGSELHILAYFMDYKDSPLVKELVKFREARSGRAKKIVENLTKLGVNISYNKVLELAAGAPIGRPHIARAIVQAGYEDNTWTVFDKYLGDSSPANVPKYKISPFDAIKMVTESGGISVWAHPRISQCEELIGPLVDAGLKGLEAVHPKHPQEDTVYLHQLASKHKLITTGGSDFHDDDSGKEVGGYGVDQIAYDSFMKFS